MTGPSLSFWWARECIDLDIPFPSSSGGASHLSLHKHTGWVEIILPSHLLHCLTYDAFWIPPNYKWEKGNPRVFWNQVGRWRKQLHLTILYFSFSMYIEGKGCHNWRVMSLYYSFTLGLLVAQVGCCFNRDHLSFQQFHKQYFHCQHWNHKQFLACNEVFIFLKARKNLYVIRWRCKMILPMCVRCQRHYFNTVLYFFIQTGGDQVLEKIDFRFFSLTTGKGRGKKKKKREGVTKSSSTISKELNKTNIFGRKFPVFHW